MTRAEHVQWAKERALAYLNEGSDVQNAFNSIVSDLNKHPETRGHIGILLGFKLTMAGQLKTSAEMREFIERLQ